MKNLLTLLSLLIIVSFSTPVNAQETNETSSDIPQNYKKRSPIYDYTEKQLNSVDTIPDFAARSNKLKITGTIYENDGVTPAKNVLLFIHQADEDGNFKLKRHNKKRYVKHRGWIRTDANGRYTFYTFVPGKYIYGNELAQILPIVKEPNKPEYKIESFIFDNDPLLTKSCRLKIEQTNPGRIIKLDKKEGLFVANRDIVLGKEAIAEY
ncbi:dioxygenase family protein [Gelatiniphilus marinus]|uniref:Intradiol ring-cleavage dioxygenases domain-containing protein n=1 Tax=Gelatiniphilus marinus TaxID=1759464 RepID=A0ABW5JN78_9FLAO